MIVYHNKHLHASQLAWPGMALRSSAQLKKPAAALSSSSSATVEHLKRPGGSRRHVSTADTALRMEAASPFSVQKNLLPNLPASRLQKFCVWWS